MELTPGYREFRPPASIREAVACLWVRTSDSGGTVHVLPDGCVDVVWQRGIGTTVVGPDTSAKLLARGAGDLLVGMRLRPGAGGDALGVPLDELRDLRVEAADLGPVFALHAELSPHAVVGRLIAGVAGLRLDPLVLAATRLVGSREVAPVARELGISERQLRRRFHSAVGYGPKTLARILRFRRFVAAVDRGESDLARIALDAGYADQAHLTRESTRLAGIAPAAFARTRSGG